MKKGEIYEGTVLELCFPNKGKIKYTDEDGTVYMCTVKDALPGQTVRFAVKKKRERKCECVLLEVLEKSPLQSKEPKCEHFGRCGGCTYEELEYEKQVELKAEMVKKLIDPVCSDYIFEGITKSPNPWEYRNKMEFSFGDEYKDGPLALGLHAKNSNYDLVNVTKCHIVNNDFNQILNAVFEYCNKKELPYFHVRRRCGYLRHLLIRRAQKTGEILVDLVTRSDVAGYDGKDPLSDAELKELSKIITNLKLNGEVVGFLHTINDSFGDAVINEKTDIVYGRDYIYEELLGLKFKVSAFSFFQTNSLGAEKLYEKAREYIGEIKGSAVFDLYSGTGTIAQMLAKSAGHVTGVEIVPEAVEAAKVNAKLNNLENCDFLAGDVLKVLDDIKEKPDYIVLDPPRAGIMPKAMEKIINYSVDRIVYISCVPTSLARDLEPLLAAGYKLQKVACVDMFPQTKGVESCVLLERVSNKKSGFLCEAEREDGR